MTDQAEDPYCQDPHHFIGIHVPDFPVWIKQCSICYFYDSDYMNEQLTDYVDKKVPLAGAWDEGFLAAVAALCPFPGNDPRRFSWFIEQPAMSENPYIKPDSRTDG